MTQASTPPPDDDRIAAAEYVLSLLSDEAHAAFELRLGREGALRELVHEWEGDLAGLAADLPERTVPPHVWSTIETRLFPDTPRPRSGTMSWLRVFVGGTALAAAVWGVLIFGGFRSGPPAIAPGVVVATLQSDAHPLRIEARYDDAARVLMIRNLTAPAQTGRDHELWFIAPDNAPVSLGLLPAEQALRVPLSPAIAQNLQGALLAVSDEPAGGSPTGAPTGAVLAAGAVNLL